MCYFESFTEKMQDNNNYTEYELLDGAEEAEEVLSLCDLPLDSNELEEITRSQLEPQYDDQLFEFMSVDHPSFEMSPAEDIIFWGNKLIPSSSSSSSSSAFDDSPKQQRTKIASDIHAHKRQHRRSESLSEFESYAAPCTKNCEVLMMRTSRSLDDQKMRRFCNPKASSTGSAHKRPAGKRSPRLLPMFGISKFPPEMDLRDIKSRQVRRTTSPVMFPSSDARGKFPANRSSSKGSSSSSSSTSSSSWKFIKALSCKDHANVAVMASLSVSNA